MSSQFDNRRSFRVSESVYLKYDVIDESEFRQGIEHRKVRLGINDGAQAKLTEIDTRLGEAMLMLNKESEKVGRVLTLMNDKLNIAIGQLPALKEMRSALAKLPPQTCDISADGIVFSSDKALDIGTHLHLRFLLSSDNRFFETFGTVVRLTEAPDTSNPANQYGIGVEFVGMKPEERETLIQHMFNRESETLRMRRLELDKLNG